MEFETVIGIEIHCELNTKSKMFSSAPNVYGAKANSCVVPLDMAFPGTMPTVNKRAVEYALMACKALGMEIDTNVRFDRKNYFYPDLPKGYQITQQYHPIGQNGYIEIDDNGNKKKIGIERLHMEEDTAKQLHYPDFTLINYNRAGVPLVEIVSKPEMHSGKEASLYVDALRTTLLYLGISDCKMEEGSMRCDVNVSINEKGAKEFGTKTEIKNLNSISNIMKAIDFEVERQKQVILTGGKVEQETRRFDEATKQTVLMRKKTNAVDYKYFTEPNIMPIQLDEKWVEGIINNIPELPAQRKTRYIDKLGLNEYDASLLVSDKELSDYFEEAVKVSNNPKITANWLITTVISLLNKEEKKLNELKFNAAQLGELIKMITDNKISSKQAKDVFEIMKDNGENPSKIAADNHMIQESDEGKLKELVLEVLKNNPDAVNTYKSGRTNILGFLVGQVLKLSKGQANPGMVNKILNEELNK